jgi:hypothetical protein
MLECHIPWRGKFVNVKPENPPADSRQLRGFLLFNDARDCFYKTTGGWYKLGLDGSLKFVCRALYLLSLQQWLEIALDDNFTENFK